MTKYTNSIICNNCFKTGHISSNCRLPITSYGIILFRYDKNNVREYLMIRRKDTYGYIDFLRGRYSLYNIEQLQLIIDEMSIEEKDRIKNENYYNLRNLLWCTNIDTNDYNQEELISQKKFENIKNGIVVNDKKINLNDIIEKSNTKWSECEWDFPKGRKNIQEKEEKDIETALREFEEETGYSRTTIKIIENILPYEENYIGSDYKYYKTKYFISFMKDDINILDNYQKTEVSKISWKNFKDCISCLRYNNFEKKQLITNVNKLLDDYILVNIL